MCVVLFPSKNFPNFDLPSNLHQVACKAVVDHSDEAPAPFFLCFQVENLNRSTTP